MSRKRIEIITTVIHMKFIFESKKLYEVIIGKGTVITKEIASF